MEFKNTTGVDQVVSIAPGKFETVKVDGVIDLDPKHGQRLGFKPLDVIHEDDVIEELDKDDVLDKPEDELQAETDKEYEKDLLSIEGIGKATAKAITEEFPVKEDLVKAVAEGNLPFNDDIAEKLSEHYKE